MSVVRISPELLATMQPGAIARVVEGGAPPDAKITSVGISDEGGVDLVIIEVEDGLEGEREVVFEKLERISYAVGTYLSRGYFQVKEFTHRADAEEYCRGANEDETSGRYIVTEIMVRPA